MVFLVPEGGPAHQSGLCQGDVVLQLNGLPVETWKCIDLAHAIRFVLFYRSPNWSFWPDLIVI